jgi:TM2 domain-containing membrane protein YozV
MTDSTEYTLRWRGRQFGPYSIAKINRKLEEHELGMGHEILCQNKWITLEQFFSSLPANAAETADPFQPAPLSAGHSSSLEMSAAPLEAVAPGKLGNNAVRVRVVASASPTAAAGPVATAVRPTSRLVFALLGVFLGFLGLHNFYALRWLTGLLQLLLSAATYLLGFGIIAPWLWAIVEAVVVRKDGAGREMI